MEIDLNTLLVALMFVTILSMGIGNILVSMADILNHASTSRRGRSHSAWILLMLLVHFNVFWHTKAILEVEGWQFGGFLLTMAGPVLMFFATSILLSNPDENDMKDLDGFFNRLGRRFYVMFALLQAWIVIADFAMAGTFQVLDLGNVVFMILALVLATQNNARAQGVGAVAAWALGLTSVVLRWLQHTF